MIDGINVSLALLPLSRSGSVFLALLQLLWPITARR